jgi:hypothetical protein
MSGLSPTSLIALQSYNAAGATQRQHRPHSEPPREAKDAPAPPRFAVEDKVQLRAPVAKAAQAKETDEAPRPPAQKRDDGVGRREAVSPDRPVYKRPGSLVDLKA